VNLQPLSASQVSLLAIQGPQAKNLLQDLVREKNGSVVDLSQLYFMNGKMNVTVDGVEGCTITRCGYSGEDGFEISIPSNHVESLAERLLQRSIPSHNQNQNQNQPQGESGDHQHAKLSGLAARDTLRLEAGLCLYGHELNEDVNLVDAQLKWCLSKRRLEEGGFPGAHIIQKLVKTPISKENPRKVRVGLILNPKEGIPREEMDVVRSDSDEVIGKTSSGTFSPTLQRGIAMAYIDGNYVPKAGCQNSSSNPPSVKIKIRSKLVDAYFHSLPFVKSNYYQKPKK